MLADELAEGQLCNEGCLLTFSSELYAGASPRQQKLCDKAPTLAAHTMYSQLCKEVLSDLPEHKDNAQSKHPGRELVLTSGPGFSIKMPSYTWS